MLPLLPLAGGALSLIGHLFGRKGEKKKAEDARKAQIAGLNIKQNMGEDSRLAKVGLGSSILSGLNTPAPAYGGRIQHNSAVDPEVLKGLQTRRSYDFASAVPNADAGGTSSFLGGLFGGAGNLLGEMDLQKQQGGNPIIGGTATPMGGQALSIEDLLKLGQGGGGA